MRQLAASSLAVCMLLCAISMPALAYATETATLTLYPGENWIAPPLVPLDPNPVSLFAGFSIDGNLRRFDATVQKTVVYTSANPTPFGNILLGDGYRINNPTSTVVTVSYVGIADGVPDSQGNLTDMLIALPGNQSDTENAGGLHWVGQPFNHDTLIASMFVTDGMGLVSIMEAVNRGWLDGLWLGYDAETQETFTVGLSAFGADEEYFRAGHMYEMMSHRDNIALIIPAPKYVPEPANVVSVLFGLGWLASHSRRRRRTLLLR